MHVHEATTVHDERPVETVMTIREIEGLRGALGDGLLDHILSRATVRRMLEDLTAVWDPYDALESDACVAHFGI